MKVLFISGSPHREGCTYAALKEVAAALKKEGIETQIKKEEPVFTDFVRWEKC